MKGSLKGERMMDERQIGGVKQAIAGMYRTDYSRDETVRKLMRNVSKEALADFIVDAFNRGWISRFNLGIDDDGNVI